MRAVLHVELVDVLDGYHVDIGAVSRLLLFVFGRVALRFFDDHLGIKLDLLGLNHWSVLPKLEVAHFIAILAFLLLVLPDLAQVVDWIVFLVLDVHQLFQVVQVIHAHLLYYREGILFFHLFLVRVEDAAVVQDVRRVHHVQDISL